MLACYRVVPATVSVVGHLGLGQWHKLLGLLALFARKHSYRMQCEPF